MKKIISLIAAVCLVLPLTSLRAGTPSGEWRLYQTQNDGRKGNSKGSIPEFTEKMAEDLRRQLEEARESFEKAREEWKNYKLLSEEQIEDLRAEFDRLRENMSEGSFNFGDEPVAEDPSTAAYSTITKDYDLRNFTGISASGVTKVELSKGSFSVRVECIDILEPYLKVRVVGKNLVIGFNDIPSSVQRKLRTDNLLKAYVSMPRLESVKLSGASSLRCNDSFDLGNNVFSCELSGATSIADVNVKAKKVMLDMSGVAKGTFNVDCDDVTSSMSGATYAKYDIASGSFTLEMSGSSKAEGAFVGNNISVEGSGVSYASLSGKSKDLKLEGSGATKFAFGDMPVSTSSVELSGSSSARVDVGSELKVELSAVSSLYYKGNNKLSLDVESVSRAATLKKY